MGNNYFRFKQFTVRQDRCAMKVTTLACIQGAWLPDLRPRKILDIGAGTGLLSFMAAQQYRAPVDAVEIEENAFAQLTENIAQNPWPDLITPYHEDIRHFAEHSGDKYDLIISNPPFFQKQLPAGNKELNMAKHDTGLTSDDLLAAVSKLLAKDGLCSILLPARESDIMISKAKNLSLFPIDRLIIYDRFDRPPLATVTILAATKMPCRTETLTIRKGDGRYSEDFVSLMRPYYLNL